MKDESHYGIELVKATKALWDWAKAGEHGNKEIMQQLQHPNNLAYHEGASKAYETVRTEMRTLFSGLIDFE